MKNTLRKLLSFLLSLALVLGSFTVFAVESDRTPSEIPYIPHDTSIADANYDGIVNTYYGQEGVDAGVPAGFSGEVIKVTHNSEPGHACLCVDYSDQNIDIDSIESITFRIYIPAGGASEFRILNKAKGSSWIVRATPSAFSEWVDVVLTATSGFESGYDISALANADGNLGAFCIVYRLKNVSGNSAYLDGITVKYKEGESDDIMPPVINYNGPISLRFKEGEIFNVDGMSAFDEYDNAPAALSYEWSDGALDGAGALKAGEHICTVKAADRSGNVSSIVLNVSVSADTSLIRLENIPYIPHDTSIADSVYDGKVTEHSADSAAAAGLPSGYNGSVYEIAYNSGKSYIGVCLDFSQYNIPINAVESITFNVLMPTSYSELRMRNGNTTDWLMRCSTAPTGKWESIVMNAAGLNFYGAANMKTLANADGNLGSCCLIGRNNGTYGPYYIDSIIIKLKDDDGVGPVLNYSGKTDILTSAGKLFLPDITAYDALEDRHIALDYAWSDGALDSDGKMIEGTHTCVVSATDYYGNTSSLTLNVTVGPPDVTAPEIIFRTGEIHVPSGTYSRMVITCVDDYDDVDVKVEWSAGAIDFGGRLSDGVHTLTLTAIDLSGNKSVKTVTVYVEAEDSVVGQLVVCG